MSLDIKALTAAIALGPQAAILASTLEPMGAEFLSGDAQSLTFDLDLEHWVAGRRLESIKSEFPGLFIQACYCMAQPDLDGLWNYYEPRMTISLPAGSVCVMVKGTSEMGNCDCMDDDEGCTICLQRGEFPALEEALEEFYRPLIARAVAEARDAESAS